MSLSHRREANNALHGYESNRLFQGFHTLKSAMTWLYDDNVRPPQFALSGTPDPPLPPYHVLWTEAAAHEAAIDTAKKRGHDAAKREQERAAQASAPATPRAASRTATASPSKITSPAHTQTINSPLRDEYGSFSHFYDPDVLSFENGGPDTCAYYSYLMFGDQTIFILLFL
jgi:hypothetical protein